MADEPTRIEKGDIVDVHFAKGGHLSNALVLYIPCATADSWHLRTEDGALVYIQSFEAMWLKAKAI